MSHERRLDSPFLKYVGIEIVAMENGVATLRLSLRDELLNSGGMAHGGVLATLADSAAGAAAFSVVSAQHIAVTTDFNLCCLKATFAGEITAIGSLVHRGQRLLRAHVDMHSNGDLIATAGVSFMVVERRL